MDDARAFTLPNGTLYFRRVEEEDAGLYACEARNNVGSVWFNGTSVILACELVFGGMGMDAEMEDGDMDGMHACAFTYLHA